MFNCLHENCDPNLIPSDKLINTLLSRQAIVTCSLVGPSHAAASCGPTKKPPTSHYPPHLPPHCIPPKFSNQSQAQSTHRSLYNPPGKLAACQSVGPQTTFFLLQFGQCWGPLHFPRHDSFQETNRSGPRSHVFMGQTPAPHPLSAPKICESVRVKFARCMCGPLGTF